VCLALALVIWVAVMNAPDTDYIATEVLATSGEYTYTLSKAHLEVEGTVADLRRAKTIGICVPQDIVPGEPYALTEDNLVIPEGVEGIGDSAFKNCTGLRTVQLPATLKGIGHWVFDGCYGIESISLDPSNERYYVDGMSLIQKSDNKLVLHFAPAPIPEGVTHIDNDTIVCGDERYELQEGIEYVESHFILGRNLKELTLPRSLTYLHVFSMVECPVLTDIYYKGTRAEWNTLTANFEEEAGREWTNGKMWFNRVTVHCIDEIEETTAGSESETKDPNVTTQPPTSSETQSPTPTGCGSTVSLPWIALVMIVPILWSRKRHRRP
jgi:hypothetical protein